MPISNAFDRKAHVLKVGLNTRFKSGHNLKGKDKLLSGDAGNKLKIKEWQFDQMMIAQAGVCAVCSRPPKKNRLAVDHDHKTGAIRGLLCFRCNYGLSWYQDDVERIERLARYIKENKDWRNQWHL